MDLQTPPMNVSESRPSVTFWIEEKTIDTLPSSAYWNDRKVESGKVFDVSDSDFTKVLKSRNNQNLLIQLQEVCQKFPQAFHGQGASLGSGICWLESELLRTISKIERLWCVEFSKHRICELAPSIVQHYRIEPTRIQLCLGSFYDLKLDAKSLDFVLLSQAYHHAFDPKGLLAEVKRVLKPGGYAVVIGEHFFTWNEVLWRAVKHPAKLFLDYRGYRNQSGVLPTWKNLFPPCEKKGDHHYNRTQYESMFDEFGFEYNRFVFRDARLQSWILVSRQ